jgi:hypothetical protein
MAGVAVKNVKCKIAERLRNEGGNGGVGCFLGVDCVGNLNRMGLW